MLLLLAFLNRTWLLSQQVEVLPATNTGGRSSGLWSSRENAGSSFRIDDAGIIVGCSAKVIESLTEASVDGAVVPSGEGAVVEVPDGTMARVDSSLGNEFEELCGFSQGSQVPRHVFADKSHSQLLVTKSGVEASGGGGGSSKDKDRGDGAAGSTQYYVVPRLEPFSRISGICKVRYLFYICHVCCPALFHSNEITRVFFSQHFFPTSPKLRSWGIASALQKKSTC